MLDPTYQPSELLYRSHYSDVYRARSSQSDATVLFRTPRKGESAQHLAKLHHERELLELLGAESRISDSEGAVGLVSSDNGGVPLSELISEGPLDAGTAVWIAAELADRVGELHEKRIIHKDINPANVLVNVETRRADLLSFGIASRLPRETHLVVNPEVLEGDLEYVSPEQTGRMNRPLDYRTDFLLARSDAPRDAVRRAAVSIGGRAGGRARPHRAHPPIAGRWRSDRAAGIGSAPSGQERRGSLPEQSRHRARSAPSPGEPRLG